MPRKRAQPTPSLLLSVMAEIGAGNIWEGWISDPGYMTDGLCEGGGRGNAQITINPAHQTVLTVLHEALHRLHPEWPESYVRNRATWLRRRLTDEQAQTIYAEYERRKKTRRTPKVVET